MPNRFYSYLSNLIPLNRAKAGDVSANLTSVEAGFQLAADELDRTVRAQAADGAMAALPLKAVRAGRALYFDTNGDPVALQAASLQQTIDASTATAASAAAAAASATTASTAATSATASLRSVRVTRAQSVLNFLGY
jgi:hypothetical protein